MLLLTGNTMSQAVRERTSEFAVFKTVGYSDKVILALVLCESLTICVASMVLGIILSYMVFLAISTDIQAFVEDIAFEFSVVSWALFTAVCMILTKCGRFGPLAVSDPSSAKPVIFALPDSG